MSEPYPLICVEGDPHEMGLQHGTACIEKINNFLIYAIEIFCFAQNQTKDRVIANTLHYLPVLERNCPHLVEELKGVAQGARLSLAEILFLHVRTELSYYKKSGCSAFAVSPEHSRNGILLSGQNWDNPPYSKNFMIVLQLKPKNKPSILLFTFAGVIGYIGINSYGISIWDNQLMCPGWKIGIPHYFVKRLVLEQRTLFESVDLLKKLEHASSENFVMTDGSGIITSMECTPQGVEEIKPTQGVIFHTNHFLTERFIPLEKFISVLPDTCNRLDRLNFLFKKFSDNLSVETIKTILSDHDNFPTSLCRHVDHTPQSMITCASVIAEPAQGVIYVSPGNPCVSSYERYEMR